jgi:Uma2 family endonuclease
MTASPRLKQQDRFTYSDYLTWPNDGRWELIDGVAYSMSPAPGRRHQEISIALASQFYIHLKGKPCKVYEAPFDVRLAERVDAQDELTCTVVQPDIVVVCDPSKLDDRGCRGTPDIVVEIMSPSTGSFDLTTKYDLYQRYAVKEYWVVLPAEQSVLVFKLQQDGLFGPPDRFAASDRITVTMLGDMMIDLAEVFAE